MGKNIKNLRYTDDTTIMAERKEELNSLLMKMKEESEKAGLKLNIQKTKIMAPGPITSWQIDEETMETVTDFIFLGSKIIADDNSVQFSSVAQSCLTVCDSSTPGLPVHHQLPEFTKTYVHESVMPSNNLILCRPLCLLLSIFPRIRVFSNQPALHIRWPKYWSFSFNISPSNGHPGLISFRMDWLDLHAEICVSSKSHLVK